MAGLYHDFYLRDIHQYSHDDYAKTDALKSDVSIHDDVLHYMFDTLTWIPCYNPAKRETHNGLCFYGATVIRGEGAVAAQRVFQSWANLFSLGPMILELHSSGEIRREARDELVSKLTKLAGLAQKIINTDGQFFILHHGL